MKKLMIVAAATAMAGAAFAACDKPVTPAVNCAEVYDVVFNLKTTKCLCDEIVTKTTSQGGCNRPISSTETVCKSWRAVTTKKVYGVIWSCMCSCYEDLDGNTLDGSTLQLPQTLWDGEDDTLETSTQFFWMPSEKYRLDSLMTFNFLGRIGAANGKVEAYGTFGDGIKFAGFGTFGQIRVKKITGAAAGCWGAPYNCVGTWDETEGKWIYDMDCPAYKTCDPKIGNEVDDYSTTAAYGTFSVKFNATKSAKLANGTFYNNVIPAKWDKLGEPVNHSYKSSAGLY